MHDAAGTTHAAPRRAARPSAAAAQSSTACCGRCARIEMHLQRADARRQFQHAGDALRAQRLEQRLHLEAQLQIQHRRPEFHQQVVFAGAADADVCGVASRDWPGRLRASDRRRIASARCAHGPLDCARECARDRRASWPTFHRSAQADGHRADEAAEAGPVGPEDHRHVAGEIDGCRPRRRCRGCWTDAGPPRRHRCAPTAASGRSGARRCGWSCSALPSRWRRTSRCPRAVKKSGAPCGPCQTRDAPAWL